MEWQLILTLFGSFAVLLAIGVPVSFAIGLSSLATILMGLPLEPAIAVVAQRMAAGLDNFALLAIPFFILAGNIMNQGGIALRLINFAKVLGGRLPGSLAHVNVMANMMFGSISGSAVASAAAVGGTMSPLQKKDGYDENFSAAVNITSCPSGLLIPPSNTLIVFSLVSGGTSIAALFLAGYIPGILMGLSIMVVAGVIAKRRGYPIAARPTLAMVWDTFLKAAPSLALIVVIMGGIIGGIFTATEASAIAVVYTFVLAVLVYREVKWRDLPKIILESAVTTSIVLLLVGASMGMSWAMANADIPYMIADALDMGIDPVHFGIMMTFNLAIGICTPPVGSALFIGCSVANVAIDKVIKPLLPFYVALIAALMAVTFIPELSLFLPKLVLGY
ncbi:TRAP transporter large permease [Vibrio parahaemolyticus]